MSARSNYSVTVSSIIVVIIAVLNIMPAFNFTILLTIAGIDIPNDELFNNH